MHSAIRLFGGAAVAMAKTKKTAKTALRIGLGIVMQTLLSCSVENCFYFVFRERALERLMRDDLF
jgi:tryptophanase